MSGDTASAWDPETLARIGAQDEIRVAPDHADGRPSDPVIIWSVVSDGALYARSARGPQGGWYRRAMASGAGRIEAAGTSYDVTFADASSDADQDAIDAAYHADYDRYGPRIVGAVVGSDSYPVTVRIAPVG